MPITYLTWMSHKCNQIWHVWTRVHRPPHRSPNFHQFCPIGLSSIIDISRNRITISLKNLHNFFDSRFSCCSHSQSTSSVRLLPQYLSDLFLPLHPYWKCFSQLELWPQLPHSLPGSNLQMDYSFYCTNRVIWFSYIQVLSGSPNKIQTL